MPEVNVTHTADGNALAQILLKLGEISTQVAVMQETLKQIPDHETRLRALETAKAKLYGGAIAAGTLSGGVATIIYWALTRR